LNSSKKGHGAKYGASGANVLGSVATTVACGLQLPNNMSDYLSHEKQTSKHYVSRLPFAVEFDNCIPVFPVL
jgi:hypothetical protein